MKKYCEYQNKLAKRYLENARALKKIATEQELSIYEFTKNPQKLTSVLNSMPKGNSKSDLSDVIVRYEKMKDKLVPQLQNTLTLYDAIIDQILNMENKTFAHMLYAYYINGKSWRTISDDIGYTWRHLMRVKEVALEEFEREYKDVILCHIKK